eukprot:TRINITY_DN4861_c0_g1_i1.p1 TRINITY_DN4861_c0_g1~~TRINITY_DN4861_c0_g1_i1.p1  ORF type:complete len:130 (+),score=32.81 TRINITY_DN4861_c0_g1_i1:54-443(+)
MSRVVVEVVSAEEVPSEDVGGKSDPYVVLQVGHEYHWGKDQWKTKAKPNTSNPVWHETFDIPIKESTKDLIKVTLYDKDDVSADDFIGQTVLDLASLKNGVPTKVSPNLKQGGKVIAAKINVILTAHFV